MRSHFASLDDEQVAAAVARIAGSFGRRLATLAAAITETLNSEIPDLGEDGPMTELLGASVEGNLGTIVYALQHDLAPESFDAPTAATEYARRLAQHGVPVNALVRAYRLGQTELLGFFFAELEAIDIDADLGIRVLERIITVMSIYIDRVSQQVVAIYETERDRWSANQSTVRAVRVQEILRGRGSPDMGTAINYEFAQHHLAVIAWMPDSHESDDLGALQAAARDLALFLDCRADPLFVAVDRVTSWYWLPLGKASDITRDIAELRAFAGDRHPRLMLALGAPAPGMEGFRRSHAQAQRARAVAVSAGKNAPAVTAYNEPGVSTVALLTDDPAATRTWVNDMLGGLAADSEDAALLRETVQAYLTNNSSNVAAAKVLNVHPNTVKYRIKKASMLRGRDIHHDRLGVELALLVCRRLRPQDRRP